MGENHFAAAPTARYRVVLLMGAIAYYVLSQTIVGAEGRDSILKTAVGRDWKTKVSLALWLAEIVVALSSPRIADTMFVFPALLWLIPDRRIEKSLNMCLGLARARRRPGGWT